MANVLVKPPKNNKKNIESVSLENMKVLGCINNKLSDIDHRAVKLKIIIGSAEFAVNSNSCNSIYPIINTVQYV